MKRVASRAGALLLAAGLTGAASAQAQALAGGQADAVGALAAANALMRAGVQADLADQPARAYVFYRLAAQGGVAEAEFNVAVMNDSGVGTPRDRAQAALWYARAAAHDFGRAAYDLGELAAAGDGIPRNAALARVWFGAADAASRVQAVPASASLAMPPTPVLDPVQTDPAAADGTAPVEFVWRVGDMPDDTRFFVQVVRLDASGMHDVAWTETRRSALLLAVPRDTGLYAWRVLAAAAATGHYAPSSWASFRVR